MNKILFPIRRQSNPLSMQPGRFIILPNSSAGVVKKGAERVEWVGMTPLDMVEEVVTMADQNLGTEDRNNMKTSHKVDTTFLACKAREVPHGIQRNVTHKASKKETHLPNIVFKRGRAFSSANGADSCKKKAVPATYLAPWNHRFITDIDYTKEGHDAVAVLGQLALQIESSPSYDLFILSYKRIRDQFTQAWATITKQYPGSRHANEISSLIRSRLNLLYAETVEQMESLLFMTMETAPTSAYQTQFTSTESRTSSPVNKEFSKKSLAEYMNNWLKDNWTNPYPDDDGLAIIAKEVGTSPIVVSNWLINARTRKWRPAIVKAFNLGRPAGMLKQDAINIFEGTPVQPLHQNSPSESESGE